MHLQERLGVPGFPLGRRHEALNGEPRYLNFYVTRSVEVLKSQEYRTRLDDPTPMTRVIMSDVFKDMIRTICHQTFRLGHMRGAVAVTARFAERPKEAALRSTLQELVKNKAVACGEIWSAASQDELVVSEEERLRGGDRRIDACLMIETLRAHGAEQLASAAVSQFPAVTIATYRLLCEIKPGNTD